jgi:hypothetical protein
MLIKIKRLKTDLLFIKEITENSYLFVIYFSKLVKLIIFKIY